MGTPCTTDKEYPPLLHQAILPKPILIMLFLLLSTAVLCSLTAGAPQYGGVQPSNPGKTAPLTGSVQCRTEYTTLWDTEYKETETQVCTTEYEKVCRTETQRLCQPTTRQECNTVYEKQCQTVYKRLSAPPSTRRTACTSGRVMAMTRSGLPLPAHAR